MHGKLLSERFNRHKASLTTCRPVAVFGRSAGGMVAPEKVEHGQERGVHAASTSELKERSNLLKASLRSCDEAA